MTKAKFLLKQVMEQVKPLDPKVGDIVTVRRGAEYDDEDGKKIKNRFAEKAEVLEEEGDFLRVLFKHNGIEGIIRKIDLVEIEDEKEKTEEGIKREKEAVVRVLKDMLSKNKGEDFEVSDKEIADKAKLSDGEVRNILFDMKIKQTPGNKFLITSEKLKNI